ncbi:DUF6263 family protein [uncultured Muriicola sp.]|uniref:DUF6263 family protein n=1 Tax=uncultured Muriicola sp. TaxID=1583102 RepID=UPI0026176FC4|nr:DUF6263 family protein [uncultured Muriicola sp.]
MKIKILLLSLFVTSMCQGILAQEKLQYNLKKGDVFLVKQVARQAIVQEIEGASHEILNDISGVMEFKVVEKNSDSYAIDITFEDLIMTMTSSIQGVLMDIHAKEVDSNNIQSRIFNSLLNVPIHIVLANNGDILEVQGGDSLVVKMTEASGLQDAFSLNMMKASLKKEFGSEALSNSYKQMTYIYPDKDITVGDTWENTYKGKLTAQNVWKLDSVTSKNAIISGIATILMEIKEPATTMLLDGKQDTSITTDLNSGFIVKMKVEGVSKGYSTIAQLGDQKIPTTISSTVTYELIQ